MTTTATTTSFKLMQPTLNFLMTEGDKRHTPERWAAVFGVEIIDWDGWRHHDCHEECDVLTFVRRLARCTIFPL